VAREIKAAGINEVRSGAQWWAPPIASSQNFIELSVMRQMPVTKSSEVRPLHMY